MKGGIMNKRISAAVIVLVFLYMVCYCQAASIYSKRSKNSKPMYSDDKANQIGDVLTIVINEDSKVDNKVKRNLSKDTSRSLDFDGREMRVEMGDFLGHVIPNMPEFTLEASSGKSLDGKSDYKDERTIEDKITVVVEDIHPNGNLVVMGTRTRDIAGDKVTMEVSGIVRPSDIAFDNSVQSDRVANFSIRTVNKGVTNDYNKPGWFAKILNFLWPL